VLFVGVWKQCFPELHTDGIRMYIAFGGSLAFMAENIELLCGVTWTFTLFGFLFDLSQDLRLVR
jgi:hypothetical protein